MIQNQSTDSLHISFERLKDTFSNVTFQFLKKYERLPKSLVLNDSFNFDFCLDIYSVSFSEIIISSIYISIHVYELF